MLEPISEINGPETGAMSEAGARWPRDDRWWSRRDLDAFSRAVLRAPRLAAAPWFLGDVRRALLEPRYRPALLALAAALRLPPHPERLARLLCFYVANLLRLVRAEHARARPRPRLALAELPAAVRRVAALLRLPDLVRAADERVAEPARADETAAFARDLVHAVSRTVRDALLETKTSWRGVAKLMRSSRAVAQFALERGLEAGAVHAFWLALVREVERRLRGEEAPALGEAEARAAELLLLYEARPLVAGAAGAAARERLLCAVVAALRRLPPPVTAGEPRMAELEAALLVRPVPRPSGSFASWVRSVWVAVGARAAGPGPLGALWAQRLWQELACEGWAGEGRLERALRRLFPVQHTVLWSTVWCNKYTVELDSPEHEEPSLGRLLEDIGDEVDYELVERAAEEELRHVEDISLSGSLSRLQAIDPRAAEVRILLEPPEPPRHVTAHHNTRIEHSSDTDDVKCGDKAYCSDSNSSVAPGEQGLHGLGSNDAEPGLADQMMSVGVDHETDLKPTNLLESLCTEKPLSSESQSALCPPPVDIKPEGPGSPPPSHESSPSPPEDALEMIIRRALNGTSRPPQHRSGPETTRIIDSDDEGNLVMDVPRDSSSPGFSSSPEDNSSSDDQMFTDGRSSPAGVQESNYKVRELAEEIVRNHFEDEQPADSALSAKLTMQCSVVVCRVDETAEWRRAAGGSLRLPAALHSLGHGLPASPAVLSRRHGLPALPARWWTRNLRLAARCRPCAVRLPRRPKRVRLPDISRVRRLNQTLLTAQVAPIRLDPDPEDPPEADDRLISPEAEFSDRPVSPEQSPEPPQAGGDTDYLRRQMMLLMAANANKYYMSMKVKPNCRRKPVKEPEEPPVLSPDEEWEMQKRAGLQYFRLPNYRPPEPKPAPSEPKPAPTAPDPALRRYVVPIPSVPPAATIRSTHTWCPPSTLHRAEPNSSPSPSVTNSPQPKIPKLTPIRPAPPTSPVGSLMDAEIENLMRPNSIGSNFPGAPSTIQDLLNAKPSLPRIGKREPRLRVKQTISVQRIWSEINKKNDPVLVIDTTSNDDPVAEPSQTINEPSKSANNTQKPTSTLFNLPGPSSKIPKPLNDIPQPTNLRNPMNKLPNTTKVLIKPHNQSTNTNSLVPTPSKSTEAVPTVSDFVELSSDDSNDASSSPTPTSDTPDATASPKPTRAPMDATGNPEPTIDPNSDSLDHNFVCDILDIDNTLSDEPRQLYKLPRDKYISLQTYLSYGGRTARALVRADRSRPLWLVGRQYLVLTAVGLPAARPSYWSTLHRAGNCWLSRILFPGETLDDPVVNQNCKPGQNPRSLLKPPENPPDLNFNDIQASNPEELIYRRGRLFRRLQADPPLQAVVYSMVQDAATFRGLVRARHPLYLLSLRTGTLGHLVLLHPEPPLPTITSVFTLASGEPQQSTSHPDDTQSNRPHPDDTQSRPPSPAVMACLEILDDDEEL